MRRSDRGLQLLSLTMALALLVLVRGDRRVTTTFAVALEARLPLGLEPAAQLPRTLRVSLSGPWARVRTLHDDDIGPILLDLSRTGPGLASWSVRPESLHLPAGVRVDALYPSQGTVELKPDLPRTLPPRTRP